MAARGLIRFAAVAVALSGSSCLMPEASAVGFFCCRKRPSPPPVPESTVIERLEFLLTRCPDWKQRDDAAHALRDHDWKEYPEIALILATSLQVDPSEEVREEAAESLAKLAPCLPEVHAALQSASVGDPDPATRRNARRALANLENRCEGSCVICGPAPAEYVVESVQVPLEIEPRPTVIEIVPDPSLPEVQLDSIPESAEDPPILLSPPVELPPPVIESPFSARMARPGYRAEVVPVRARRASPSPVLLFTSRPR
jgi:HEAT repeats